MKTTDEIRLEKVLEKTAIIADRMSEIYAALDAASIDFIEIMRVVGIMMSNGSYYQASARVDELIKNLELRDVYQAQLLKSFREFREVLRNA